MYLFFIRIIVMFYIVFTSFLLVKSLSSLIFDKNVKLKDLILIPFWPIMILSENGLFKLVDALGARSSDEK